MRPFAGMLRSTQLIAVAMVFGVVSFLGVAMFVKGLPNAPATMKTYVLLGCTLPMLGVRFVLPDMVATAARRRIAEGTWQPPRTEDGNPAQALELIEQTGDAGRLAYSFLTRTILCTAPLEASAMLAVFAFLLEASLVALVAALVWIVVLAAQIPTESRLQHWLENQLELLRREKP